MKTTKENNAQVEHEQIAQRAKEIWQNEGRQTGRDVEYWFRAERELYSRSRTGSNRQSAEATRTAPSPETGRPARVVHI